MPPALIRRAPIAAFAVLLLALVGVPARGDEAPSLTPENRDYDQKHIRLDVRFDHVSQQN